MYGTASYDTAAEGSPTAFYNKERNINGLGAVYTDASLSENRPVYWYGKIGLMYPSDYGYATNGGSTYNRTTCLGYQMSGWNSGSYKTDCAINSYLWYTNITSTAPGTSGTVQWTLSPESLDAGIVFGVGSTGSVGGYNATSISGVRPAIYLKPNLVITGGNGTWNDPYIIDATNDVTETKTYWFPATLDTDYIFPATGGTVQSSGTATGHNVYIGQDSNKYYACATISGNEICLSQPYTQYGLSGHTMGSNFTNSEKLSAVQAIYQAFVDAGIDVTLSSNCNANNDNAYCYFNGFYCEVLNSGYVRCNDDTEGMSCDVDPNGHSNCG